MASDNQFPIGQRINLAGHFPEPVVLEAVRAERLNEALSSAFGGVAVYADETAESPHRLHFFELSIRGPNTKGDQCAGYWLYVVWNPLASPDSEPLKIRNPVKHLDHAKREVVRYFDIPADAIERAAITEGQ